MLTELHIIYQLTKSFQKPFSNAACWATCPYFDNLDLDILMQVVLSASLSCLDHCSFLFKL